MNNETPFECVPNALFKMYCNRDAGRSKFIASIADGGIDYVKSILDSNNIVKTSEYGGLDNGGNIEESNNNKIEDRPNLDKYLEAIRDLRTSLKYSLNLSKFESEPYLKAINDIKAYIYNADNDNTEAPIHDIIILMNSELYIRSAKI